MKFRTTAFLLLITALSTPAIADPAFDLWARGRYEEAIKQGAAENTPEGLSVAARAAVSEMTLHTTPCMDCINRAEDLSRKALAADPRGVYPTLCLAAALGYRGRLVGLMAARRAKLAEISKQAVGGALAAHPKNAELIATLGGWNLEVVRVAGSLLARWTYGATVDQGLEKFDEALKLAPNDILINYNYGLALAASDPDKYHDMITAAWKRAVSAPSQTSYDDAEKKHAAELLALIDGNDRDAFEAKLKSYMGIPE